MTFNPATIIGVILLCMMAAEYAVRMESIAQGSIEVPEAYRERLKVLDREAIETAYKAQVTHLFEVWMKDDTKQPDRATKGVNQAKKAYVQAMEAIERR